MRFHILMIFIRNAVLVLDSWEMPISFKLEVTLQDRKRSLAVLDCPHLGVVRCQVFPYHLPKTKALRMAASMNMGTQEKYIEVGDGTNGTLTGLTIHKSNILGEGAFGVVCKGTWNEQEVAIKSLQFGAMEEDISSLKSEIAVMKHLGEHDNLVTLIGNTMRDGQLQIVMEYCPYGSLLNYLRKEGSKLYSGHKSNTKKFRTEVSDEFSLRRLLRWSYEISNAMEYLQSKQVIHADLATRNVLLNAALAAKVSDFGLSRKLYGNPAYRKNKTCALPWRWMATESLKYLEFSHASDVWAFGITLWEIFSFGEVPYAGMDWTTDFANRLATGLRLHKPEHADRNTFDMMLKCWSYNPFDRPNFAFLKEQLYNQLTCCGPTSTFKFRMTSLSTMIGHFSKYFKVKRSEHVDLESSSKENSKSKYVYLPLSDAEAQGFYGYGIKETDIDYSDARTLGSSRTSDVFLVHYKGFNVVMKKSKEDSTESMEMLMKETKILMRLGQHSNLVKLIGITHNANLKVFSLVTEYCLNGTLLWYLQSHRDQFIEALDNTLQITKADSNSWSSGQLGNQFTIDRLHRWSFEIACALAYVAEKKVIHGDVELRSVLLSSNYTAKVYDFGLSLQTYECVIYKVAKQAILPWRWMAIESLKYLEFSSQSDVWAYGVTLWEMYSFGQMPYGESNWTTDICDKLTNGSLSLPHPEPAPLPLFKLMQRCWEEDPSNRPSFEEIKWRIYDFGFLHDK